jgi:3-dehydroquinate synthase
MMELEVKSGKGNYSIYIGKKEYSLLPDYLEKAHIHTDSPIVLVADKNVLGLSYPQQILSILEHAGYKAYIIDVEPGDESKSLATCESIYYRLLDLGIHRTGVIIAVGGGVIGDLAGFIAATFERGIRFIQAPTTLLAHDSSIGGKVGINLARGKNLVGAFYPPNFVLYDVTVLGSLPEREWRNGMAEVIKHGLIGNKNLLARLYEHPLTSFPGAADAEQLLAAGMKVKVDIVEEDELESGIRMALNLGHTIGHAVEQLSHYAIHHGEAVAIGICAEAQISVARGYLTREEALYIKELFQKHGLPTEVPDLPIEDVFAKIEVDKKHRGSGWTFALPSMTERAKIVHDVTRGEVRAACELS